MAVKPKVKSLNADSNQIINAVMNEIDPQGNYPRAVDIAANENGRTVIVQTADQSRELLGQIVGSNPEFGNSFFKNLLNRIAFVLYESLSYSNPLKRLKGGYLEAGDIVEEVVMALVNPHQYDSQSDYHFPKQEKTKIYNAIHKLNFQKFYKTTVNYDKLVQAFNSKNGMEEFARELVNMLYTSAEVDEFIIMKYLLGRIALNGEMTVIPVSINDEGMTKKTLAKVKSVSNQMTFVGTEYNYMNVPTVTPKDRQIIFINSDLDATLSVETYAYMFNLNVGQLDGMIIQLNEWTEFENERLKLLFTDEETGEVAAEFEPFTAEEIAKLNNTPLFLIDDRFFKIWDYLMSFTSFYNPEKLYWNYWLHTWKILSASPFVNAVAFTTEDGAVNKIEITPDSVKVKPGSTVTFYVDVEFNGVGTKKYALIPTYSSVDMENYVNIDMNTVSIGKECPDGIITLTAKANGFESKMTIEVY